MATPDRFKYIGVTQGGADTYAEGTLTTGILPEDGQAWEITLIEAQFTPAQLSGLSADHYFTLSITRDTKAGATTYDDPDCVAIFGYAGALTTSGTYQHDIVKQWVPPAGTLFVEPEIFFGLNSLATGVAMAVKVRIHYQLVKVSEVDILRLLQNA